MQNRLKTILFLSTALFSTVALAGHYVSGFGETRTLACADAENRAEEQAQAKGTCYRQCEYDKCKKKKGEWKCRAEVSNHERRDGGLCTKKK